MPSGRLEKDETCSNDSEGGHSQYAVTGFRQERMHMFYGSMGLAKEILGRHQQVHSYLLPCLKAAWSCGQASVL